VTGKKDKMVLRFTALETEWITMVILLEKQSTRDVRLDKNLKPQMKPLEGTEH
jgi:hypothetical protein